MSSYTEQGSQNRQYVTWDRKSCGLLLALTAMVTLRSFFFGPSGAARSLLCLFSIHPALLLLLATWLPAYERWRPLAVILEAVGIAVLEKRYSENMVDIGVSKAAVFLMARFIFPFWQSVAFLLPERLSLLRLVLINATMLAINDYFSAPRGLTHRVLESPGEIAADAAVQALLGLAIPFLVGAVLHRRQAGLQRRKAYASRKKTDAAWEDDVATPDEASFNAALRHDATLPTPAVAPTYRPGGAPPRPPAGAVKLGVLASRSLGHVVLRGAMNRAGLANSTAAPSVNARASATGSDLMGGGAGLVAAAGAAPGAPRSGSVIYKAKVFQTDWVLSCKVHGLQVMDLDEETYARLRQHVASRLETGGGSYEVSITAHSGCVLFAVCVRGANAELSAAAASDALKEIDLLEALPEHLRRRITRVEVSHHRALPQLAVFPPAIASGAGRRVLSVRAAPGPLPEAAAGVRPVVWDIGRSAAVPCTFSVVEGPEGEQEYRVEFELDESAAEGAAAPPRRVAALEVQLVACDAEGKALGLVSAPRAVPAIPSAAAAEVFALAQEDGASAAGLASDLSFVLGNGKAAVVDVALSLAHFCRDAGMTATAALLAQAVPPPAAVAASLQSDEGRAAASASAAASVSSKAPLGLAPSSPSRRDVRQAFSGAPATRRGTRWNRRPSPCSSRGHGRRAAPAPPAARLLAVDGR